MPLHADILAELFSYAVVSPLPESTRQCSDAMLPRDEANIRPFTLGVTMFKIFRFPARLSPTIDELI